MHVSLFLLLQVEKDMLMRYYQTWVNAISSQFLIFNFT